MAHAKQPDELANRTKDNRFEWKAADNVNEKPGTCIAQCSNLGLHVDDLPGIDEPGPEAQGDVKPEHDINENHRG